MIKDLDHFLTIKNFLLPRFETRRLLYPCSANRVNENLVIKTFNHNQLSEKRVYSITNQNNVVSNIKLLYNVNASTCVTDNDNYDT